MESSINSDIFQILGWMSLFIPAESGVHTIAYAFPNVKIVTTAVDPEINEKFHVLPGIGNFGDRWEFELKIILLLF